MDLPEIPSPMKRLEILNLERPLPAAEREKSGRELVIVSGLPRSGTSLMMQMLEAGGIGIISDGERTADEDNPKGYYEWEAIKQIAKRPELLDGPDLDRKAVKVLSMLLAKLPKSHLYKVLFMLRPVEEVIASQEAMIRRLETEGAQLEREDLRRGLQAHREETLRWLQRAKHMQVLRVDYPQLVASPEALVAPIVEFLGRDLLPHPERMAAVVNPSLYRQHA